MKNETLIHEFQENGEKCVNMINSFNDLSAENDEIIDSIESLKKQSAMIKNSYAEIVLNTKKLFEAMNELALLAAK
jgi:hypothetical protein